MKTPEQRIESEVIAASIAIVDAHRQRRHAGQFTGDLVVEETRLHKAVDQLRAYRKQQARDRRAGTCR